MDYPAAIGAGLIGGAVTSVILYMGIAMMPGQIKMDLFYLLGSMTFRRKVMVYLGRSHGLCRNEHRVCPDLRRSF